MKRVYKYAIPVAAIIAQGVDEPADADLFLKLADIEGESIDENHKGEIDVLAWSWGVSNTGFDGGFGGGGTGKSAFTPVKVIKSVDSATAALIAKAAMTDVIPEAILSITRNSGKGEEEYMKVTLTDVLVSKVAHGGQESEAGTAETVNLDWTKIKVEYRTQLKDGTFGPWQETCWDRASNAWTNSLISWWPLAGRS